MHSSLWMRLQRCSSVATIFGPPPRKQLVWAPGQGVTATTSSRRAPGGPLQPRGPPPRSRGLRGPRYATAEVCSQATSFESCHSEILDQIRSQNKILQKLAESIQMVQTQMKDSSREVESKLESVQFGFSELKSESKSSLKNLSWEVESSMKNLSREVEFKLESVQLGYSELKLESRSSLKNLIAWGWIELEELIAWGWIEHEELIAGGWIELEELIAWGWIELEEFIAWGWIQVGISSVGIFRTEIRDWTATKPDDQLLCSNIRDFYRVLI